MKKVDFLPTELNLSRLFYCKYETEWIPYTKRSSALTSYAREKEDYEVRDDYPSPKDYYYKEYGILLRPHDLIGPTYEEQQGQLYCYSNTLGKVAGAMTFEYFGIRPCIWVALDEEP